MQFVVFEEDMKRKVLWLFTEWLFMEMERMEAIKLVMGLVVSLRL
jgi:hypothetical protein